MFNSYSQKTNLSNSLKKIADSLYIYPSITLLIKKEKEIISYIYTNSGERDYDKKVDEMKNAIIGCKSLNNIIK